MMRCPEPDQARAKSQRPAQYDGAPPLVREHGRRGRGNHQEGIGEQDPGDWDDKDRDNPLRGEEEEIPEPLCLDRTLVLGKANESRTK